MHSIYLYRNRQQIIVSCQLISKVIHISSFCSISVVHVVAISQAASLSGPPWLTKQSKKTWHLRRSPSPHLKRMPARNSLIMLSKFNEFLVARVIIPCSYILAANGFTVVVNKRSKSAKYSVRTSFMIFLNSLRLSSPIIIGFLDSLLVTLTKLECNNILNKGSIDSHLLHIFVLKINWWKCQYPILVLALELCNEVSLLCQVSDLHTHLHNILEALHIHHFQSF